MRPITLAISAVIVLALGVGVVLAWNIGVDLVHGMFKLLEIFITGIGVSR